MTLEFLEITEMAKNEVTQVVPRKLRGTLTIKEADDMEFRADRLTGLSKQEEIAKSSHGKLYRTVGEKKRSTIAYIKAPEDTVDLPALLMDNVEQLTKGMETKAKPKVDGMTLMKSDELDITFNKQKRVLELTFTIELEKTPAYDTRLMQLMMYSAQCFAANLDLLTKPKK